ncbi:hypothetical protein HHUSO_G27334 [Huso huso]|uniref:ISXO2-like transposase domain-containing protein n=1 Tax=Huso huso TaxID=61971 RepID=A0ABR0YJG0_HUSHU
MKKLCGSCDGWTWACRRHTHRGKKVTRTIRTKSQFAGSKSSLFSWMKFVYRFAQGLRLRQIDTIEDGIAKSSCTLSTMAKRLRVICSTAIKAHKEKNKMKIGGCQSYIVRDESKFAHKRKYGRRRYSGAQRRKSWVFGLLEVKQQHRRPVLNLVARRSQQRLLPIIVKHVHPGCTIISDEWRAYVRLLNHNGYCHFHVNHSQNFVDPVSSAHTQHIESAWKTYKTEVWRLRDKGTEKSLALHLEVIEWFYWLGVNHRHGILGSLLNDIRRATKYILKRNVKIFFVKLITSEIK